MRCPNCGGIAHHILTDWHGKCYYQCTTGLTHLEKNGETSTQIVPCRTIIDENGGEYDGSIVYKAPAGNMVTETAEELKK